MMRTNSRDLCETGFGIRSLVNGCLVLRDEELRDLLPITSPDLARKLLGKLSESLPYQSEPDLELVARYAQAAEMKPNRWLGIFRKENPIINVYRFYVANDLIQKILRSEDNSNFEENISSLRQIASQIPNEIFTVISDLIRSNPRVPGAGYILHAIIQDDFFLKSRFTNFVIENFENSNYTMQEKFIYHLSLIDPTPFEVLLKRNRELDHSTINSTSQIMAALLGMPNAAESSFDDVKKFLYEKLLLDKKSLLKARILADLLESSYDSKISQEILKNITKFSAISQNFRICQQLLPEKSNDFGFITRSIFKVFTPKPKPDFSKIKFKKATPHQKRNRKVSLHH